MISTWMHWSSSDVMLNSARAEPLASTWRSSKLRCFGTSLASTREALDPPTTVIADVIDKPCAEVYTRPEYEQWIISYFSAPDLPPR
jgi:hypothetical protein